MTKIKDLIPKFKKRNLRFWSKTLHLSHSLTNAQTHLLHPTFVQFFLFLFSMYKDRWDKKQLIYNAIPWCKGPSRCFANHSTPVSTELKRYQLQFILHWKIVVDSFANHSTPVSTQIWNNISFISFYIALSLLIVFSFFVRP